MVMRPRWFSLPLRLVCGVLVAAFAMMRWLQTSTLAQEQATGQTSSQAEWRRIEEGLDELLATQGQILDRLADVLEEAKIVKIRATMQ